MLDRNSDGRITRAQAIDLIEARLAQDVELTAQRLDPVRLGADYPTRRFTDGWRLTIDCPGGQSRRLDLLLPRAFPAGYPRTALVDRGEYLDWPHVERDGVLCLLPIGAEVDPEDPATVAINLLARSARLLSELLDGAIVERDFREEFLTYWFYAADADAPVIRSLVRPEGPSRVVRVWRDHDGSMVVGEDAASLSRWLVNLYGEKNRHKVYHSEPAALLWLTEPMVPAQYPVAGADLLDVAKLSDDATGSVLATVAEGTAEDCVVLIGSLGRGGPGLIAATTTVAKKRPGARGQAQHPMTKGFRHKALPAGVASMRMFSSATLLRSNVQRADAAWIHGRGGDTRALTLAGASVLILGIGSLGSSVAARLARAGVRHLDFADQERLTWSNVGRHELGADAVGANKAEELAQRIQRELPHAEVVGHARSAASLMRLSPEIFENADLIVCTTGSWDAEAAINRWHHARGRRKPVIYGWMEDRALAAHAVTIGASGGCLRCGFGATGIPNFSAIAWPDGRQLVEEPACGNPYQPYGAVELGNAVNLVTRAAIDALLEGPSSSSHRIWLAERPDVVISGADWSLNLRREQPQSLDGGMLVRRAWAANCDLCDRPLESAA